MPDIGWPLSQSKLWKSFIQYSFFSGGGYLVTELTSVFHASVLLLAMNFLKTSSK